MNAREIERSVVWALQGDLQPTIDFWGDAAAAAGLPRERFMDEVSRLRESGRLKRVGAVVRHGAAGYSHNAMLAMRVPYDRVDEAGAAVSGLGFVSHCYERAVPQGFPYNLFAMIHARSESELEERVSEAVSLARPESRATLRTVREVKKESMRFVAPQSRREPGGF